MIHGEQIAIFTLDLECWMIEIGLHLIAYIVLYKYIESEESKMYLKLFSLM